MDAGARGSLHPHRSPRDPGVFCVAVPSCDKMSVAVKDISRQQLSGGIAVLIRFASSALGTPSRWRIAYATWRAEVNRSGLRSPSLPNHGGIGGSATPANSE